ncbi:hypothetical protein Enr13x_76780 [Stieleria neptunia]|uniref:Uncharacterized protein n=1 Tax=Stieleria neptunia TaxID=2527979 RepID=A0A518I3Y3_9BACT|nr:hypothetical protein [Stieleria neptunia]QDV47766.1 hypothetical protein Enr13x_76780 [Stieleria neptunia]
MMPKFATVLFCCTLATLITGLGWVAVTRRSIAADIVALRQELESLHKSTRLEKARRDQFSNDVDLIANVFDHCRTAEDLPRLGGHRIISNSDNGESVAFYVPEGGHQLGVRCVWKPTADKTNSATSTEPDTATAESLAGESTWSIPLVAERSYLFDRVGSWNDAQPIGWKLACEDESSFPVRTEMLPLPPLRANGGSWSTYRRAVFPNQVNFKVLGNATGRGFMPSPLRLAEWSRFGRIDNVGLKITFELTLTSDNPPVVSATDAEVFLILSKGDRLGDSLGGGRYAVRTH